MIFKILIIILLILLCTIFSKNLITNSVVINIIDGDTITVIQNKKKIKCRLAGIDAPEKSQSYGQMSKKNLSKLIYKKPVHINIIDTDRYNRAVCWITTSYGLNVNLEQVKKGMAWVYRRYTGYIELYRAEDKAKKEKRGLWSDNNPIAPWAYRKKYSK